MISVQQLLVRNCPNFGQISMDSIPDTGWDVMNPTPSPPPRPPPFLRYLLVPGGTCRAKPATYTLLWDNPVMHFIVMSGGRVQAVRTHIRTYTSNQPVGHPAEDIAFSWGRLRPTQTPPSDIQQKISV